jgi:hypothetical protein
VRSYALLHSFDVRYDYSVGQQRYSNDVYAFALSYTSGSDVSRQIVAEHPVGKSVSVYYCPTQPQQAVLRKGLMIRDFHVPLILVPFNCIMFLGFYILLKSRRLFRSERCWFRDFPIQYDGSILRLRVGYHDPIILAIAAPIPAVFIAIPFGLLGNLDIALLVGWGMAILSVILGFWLATYWNHSDLYPVIIDKMNGTLSLPRQPDQTRGPVVPFSAIEDLTLSNHSGRNRPNHVLTLHYRCGGMSKSAIVASNHNRGLFLHFCRDIDGTELTALKDWLMCKINEVRESTATARL